MPTIQVVKPFTLQLDPHTSEMPDPFDNSKTMTVTAPSELRYYDIGIYDVESHVAEHWYVKAHLKGYEEPAKPPGTAEFAMVQAQAQKPIEQKDATDEAKEAPQEPSQPMPPDAKPPRPAPIPAQVRRAEARSEPRS